MEGASPGLIGEDDLASSEASATSAIAIGRVRVCRSSMGSMFHAADRMATAHARVDTHGDEGNNRWSAANTDEAPSAAARCTGAPASEPGGARASLKRAPPRERTQLPPGPRLGGDLVPLAPDLVVAPAARPADAVELVADLAPGRGRDPTRTTMTQNSAEIMAKTAPITP